MRRYINILFMILHIFGALASMEAATSQNIWISVSISASVHNVTKDLWYNSITNAVADASNNNLIEVYPGTYNESVTIDNFTNLTIRAWAWTNAQDNTNTIINGSGFNTAFKLNTSSLITIQGFSIINATNAVVITNAAVSNTIANNNIFSNENGLKIVGNLVKNNFFISNNIYKNNSTGIRLISSLSNIIKNNIMYSNRNGASGSCIYIDGADYNVIAHNSIYGNYDAIYLKNGATWNSINTNEIYNQDNYGVYFDNDSDDNNSIISNKFYNNNLRSILIRYADNIDIINNRFFNNSGISIYLYWTATNINISHNVIYSNSAGAILFNNQPSYNSIISNRISDSSGTGISITVGDYNDIIGNIIYGMGNQGVYLTGAGGSDYNNVINNVCSNNFIGIEIGDHAANNFISGNRIVSNGDGINIGYDGSDYNTVQSNIVLDNSGGYGIRVGNADYAVIAYNIITNSGTSGILFENVVDGVQVYGNRIYNRDDAIYYNTTGNGNKIFLNSFKNNQNGVYIANTGIISNLSKNNFKSNSVFDITNTTAQYVRATNNWFGSTSVTNIRNKIHSNGGDTNFIPYRLFGEFDITPGADTTNLSRVTWTTGYAVNKDVVIKWTKTTGGDFVKYNVYRTTNSTGWSNLTYNDVWTQINNISTTNITNYNLSAGTYYYYITAMDSSTPWTNECWYSPEAVATVVNYTNVHNVTQDKWYQTITNAIAEASNNNLIEIYPGTYNESVTIDNFTNLTIRAWAWTNAQDNTNTIINGSGFNTAFKLNTSSLITIQGFSIKGATNGVYITGASVSNYIENNNIYSNETRGVYLDSDTADNNYILTNNIWGLNQNYGICIEDSDKNSIESNKIHNTLSFGIYLGNSAQMNYISHNVIYSNDSRGIFFNGDNVDNNYVMTNEIWGQNQNYGIYIGYADNNQVKSNRIHNNEQFGIQLYGSAQSNYIANNNIYSNDNYGIYFYNNAGGINYIFTNEIWGLNQDYGINIINSRMQDIYQNRIYNNQLRGIYIADSTNTIIRNNEIYKNPTGVKVSVSKSIKVMLNTIVSNNTGVWLTNTSSFTLVKNNIYTNTTYNLSLNTSSLILTNNWWGTTIISGIKAKVSGINGTNLIPYRLFGEFDITPGADTTNLSRVTYATAYIVNNDDIVIKWSSISGGDFVKYNVYRTTNSTKWSNLTYNDVWTQINNISTTNITNYNMATGSYYYYITAMDSSTPYTNECWYSPEAVATVIMPTNVHNVTQDKWYQTITNAIAEASNNNVIEVYPGIYNEILDLTGFSNLTLQAYAWTNTGNNFNTIIVGDNNNETILFDDTKKCRLIGFTIKYGSGSGIILDNASYSNYIANNIIFSNDDYGIRIKTDDADGNTIVSNVIYSNYNGGGDRGGIRVDDGDNNRIEYNTIYKFNEAGIVLTGTASNNYIFQNSIYSNVNYGISINDITVLRNTIMSNYCYNNDIGVFIGQAAAPQDVIGNFTYKNTDNGIFVQTSGNRIYYNTSYSNQTGSGIRIENVAYNTNYGNIAYDNLYGIYINTGTNTLVYSNYIYNNGTGVYGLKSSDILVQKNSVYNNATNGIYLVDTFSFGTTGDKILNNNIYSNSVYGIYLSGDWLDNNEITSNNIYDNVSAGIYINLSDNNRIFANSLISGSTNGIYIVNGSDNTVVSNNYIANNSGYGIYADDGTGLKVNLNTITSNNIGLAYEDSVAVNFGANNIMANTNLNFYNNTAASVSATNIWWGSTIYTNIDKGITNAGNTSANWVPYRLFGEFNIEPNANTTYLPRMTMATAYIVNNDDVVIKWGSTSGGDFVKYNVYRTTNSTGWSNLTYNDVWTQINNISTTNITNYNMPVGTYYYYITAMDSSTPYTNECWYSPEAVATVVPPVNNVWNITKDTYYNSIMSAVSNASNNNVLEIITAKTYNEKIILSPSTTAATNLTIGSYSWWTNNDNTSTIISVGGIDSSVIVISNNYSLRLEGVVISGATNYGIHKLGIGACAFNYNIFTNNKYGVLIQSGVSNTVFSNEFYNNLYDGLFLAGSVGCNVKKNEFYNNSGNGILISLGNKNNIISNTAYSNNTGMNIVNSAYSNRIYDNTIYNNPSYGIVVGNSMSNLIMHNTVFGASQSTGILFNDFARNNKILNNIINGNNGSGILFYTNSFLNNITGNTIFNNSAAGINFVKNNTNNYIFNNIIYSNSSAIAFRTNCNNNTVTNNFMVGTNYGVIIVSAENNKIYDNDIVNSMFGVNISSAQKNYVYYNSFTNNNYGVYLTTSRSNYVENNYFKYSVNNSVFGSLSTNNYILNNEVYSNYNTGMSFFKSYQNYIKYNKVYNSGSGITLVSNSYYNELTHNTNYNNNYNGIMLYGKNNYNYVANNVVYSNNRIGATNGSIVLIDSSFNTLTNNICFGSGQYFGISIVNYSSNNRTINNSVYNDIYVGIALKNVANNLVENNNVYNNDNGISLGTVTSSTLYFNNIRNVSNGLWVMDSTNIEVKYNYVANNSGVGFKGSRVMFSRWS